MSATPEKALEAARIAIALKKTEDGAHHSANLVLAGEWDEQHEVQDALRGIRAYQAAIASLSSPEAPGAEPVAPPASAGVRVKALDVDDLAQEIRRVDGSNSLGAGALAEALMPFLTAQPSPSPVGGEWTQADLERENAAFHDWWKACGYDAFPDLYPPTCQNAMRVAWREAAKRGRSTSPAEHPAPPAPASASPAVSEAMASAIYSAYGYDPEGKTISPKYGPYGEWAKAIKAAEAVAALALPQQGWRDMSSAFPAVSEAMVEAAWRVYIAKLKEYDADFRRPIAEDGFWKRKYGTHLHSTSLGERWAMRAALTAALALPQQGWRLVPVEPTEAMLDAYWNSASESKEMRARTHARGKHYYHAMIAAAPPLPLARAEREGSEMPKLTETQRKMMLRLEQRAIAESEPGFAKVRSAFEALERQGIAERVQDDFGEWIWQLKEPRP